MTEEWFNLDCLCGCPNWYNKIIGKPSYCRTCGGKLE